MLMKIQEDQLKLWRWLKPLIGLRNELIDRIKGGMNKLIVYIFGRINKTIENKLKTYTPLYTSKTRCLSADNTQRIQVLSNKSLRCIMVSELDLQC